MARKTVSVEEVKEWANSFLRLSADIAQGQRTGVYILLERVLHDTGNYKGFNYLNRPECAYSRALWYAWGRIDEMPAGSGLAVDDGFKFATLYQGRYVAFKLEERHMLSSLIQQWEEYVKTRG